MTLTPDDEGTPTASGWEARRRRVARHIENEAIALFAEQGYATAVQAAAAPRISAGSATGRMLSIWSPT